MHLLFPALDTVHIVIVRRHGQSRANRKPKERLYLERSGAGPYRKKGTRPRRDYPRLILRPREGRTFDGRNNPKATPSHHCILGMSCSSGLAWAAAPTVSGWWRFAPLHWAQDVSVFVEENPIGERTDGPVTELAEKPELAGHSEGGGEERAPLLCARPTLEPGSILLHVAPRAIRRSSLGESLCCSSHFLNIISDY